MSRATKHLLTLSLVATMTCQPGFTQADNTSKRRPTSRPTAKRSFGTTRTVPSRQPVTRRPYTLPTSPNRFTNPTRPTTVRPPVNSRPLTSRPIRDPGKTITPTRRPTVTRLPATRPVITVPQVTRPGFTRPSSGKQVQPVRPDPTHRNDYHRPGLDTLLRQANKARPIIQDTVRPARPIEGRITDANKLVLPLKDYKKDQGNVRITGDEREGPVRANRRPGTGNSAEETNVDSDENNAPIDPTQPGGTDAVEAAPTADEAGDAADAEATPDEVGEAAEAPAEAEDAEEAPEGEDSPEATEDAEEDPVDPADTEEEAPEAAADADEAADDSDEVADETGDSEAVPVDPALIILPGFTFVLGGGGGQYIQETQIVETIVTTETGPVVALNEDRVQEVATLPEVRAGSTYNLSAMNLGQEPGHVVIEVNELYLETTVDKWSNERATVTLPLVGMAKPQRAALLMLDAKGQVVESIEVMFLPAKEDSK